jgi:hypothetical protein
MMPNNRADQFNRHPSAEEIRERAYEIYVRRSGEPGDGRDVDDWIAAETELLGFDRIETTPEDSDKKSKAAAQRK